MINYGRELEEMRRNYYNSPLKKLKLPIEEPALKDPRYSHCYLEADYLISSGTICYACIVQANTLLFNPLLPVDCPACLLFSTADWICRDPDALKKAAHYLFSLKGKPMREVPINLRAIASSITDEQSTVFESFTVTSQNGEPAEVYFGAHWIFRKYLPGYTMKGSVFPVFASPLNCKSVAILPKKYWTEAYTSAWKNKEL